MNDVRTPTGTWLSVIGQSSNPPHTDFLFIKKFEILGGKKQINELFSSISLSLLLPSTIVPIFFIVLVKKNIVKNKCV